MPSHVHVHLDAHTSFHKRIRPGQGGSAGWPQPPAYCRLVFSSAVNRLNPVDKLPAGRAGSGHYRALEVR